MSGLSYTILPNTVPPGNDLIFTSAGAALAYLERNPEPGTVAYVRTPAYPGAFYGRYTCFRVSERERVAS